MDKECLVACHVLADSSRIHVPKHLIRSIDWLQKDNPTKAWLFLVTPGRYRLLSDDQVKSDSLLEPIRLLLIEGKSFEEADPSTINDPQLVAKVAKLAPVPIVRRDESLRIIFPAVFEQFVPAECRPKAFTFIFTCAGYLEIWYTDVLRNALLDPIQLAHNSENQQ